MHVAVIKASISTRVGISAKNYPQPPCKPLSEFTVRVPLMCGGHSDWWWLMWRAVRHSAYVCHCHSLFDKLMMGIKSCENQPRSLHLLLSWISIQFSSRQDSWSTLLHAVLLVVPSLSPAFYHSSSCPPAPDQCPQHFSQCSVELWQRLDQPAVQLEQPGSCPVAQAPEAAVRGAAVSPLRWGWLQLRRWGRWRRRGRWVVGGRWRLSGQDWLHVPVAERTPTPEDGVSGDSELHGFAPWLSAAGRCGASIEFISGVFVESTASNIWVGAQHGQKHSGLHKTLLTWQ